MTRCGAGGAQEPFEFKGRDHVVNAPVTVFGNDGRVENVIAGSYDDRPGFDFDCPVLLLEINGLGLASLCAHAALLALPSCRQLGASIVKTEGMPWAKYLYMALRCPIPALNTSTAIVGHFSAHDPQPVHSSSFT